MKPIDVKRSTYIDFGVENNNKDLKLKVGDHVRISKNKNISAKAYTQNWSDKGSVVKKVKNIVPWKYVIEEQLDLSNYAKTSDLIKGATGIDASINFC